MIPSKQLIWILLNCMFVWACQARDPQTSNQPKERILTIHSSTQEPDLPQIAIPGLELKIIAGSGQAGYREGSAMEARFSRPSGIAMDAQRNLYIADLDNHRIRKLDSQGIVSTIAGNGKNGTNKPIGSAKSVELGFPSTLAYWPPDRLLIHGAYYDSILNLTSSQMSLLFQSDSEPDFYRNLSETSFTDLPFPFTKTHFFVEKGSLYLVSLALWKVQATQTAYSLQRYTGREVEEISNQQPDNPHRYFKDGSPDEAMFNAPEDISFDSLGNGYVADSKNHRIRKIDRLTREVSTYTGYAGSNYQGFYDAEPTGGFQDGPLQDARLNFPLVLERTESQDLIVLDAGNKAIRIVFQGQVRTLIKNLDSYGMVLDGNKLYLSDAKNHQIYSMDLTGLEQLKPEMLKQITVP